jgi:hypothetical protein
VGEGKLVTRAIVYTPGFDYERADRCIDYVRACGYQFKGLVRDWEIVKQMMGDGECSVAIVADPSELPPDRKPRIEFVSHPPQPQRMANGGRYWDERTRVIRRGTWEE